MPTEPGIDHRPDAPFTRTASLDDTPAFFADGFEYIGRRCEILGTDAFATRLFLQKVLCIHGEQAARVFYGEGNFTRAGATPATAAHLLEDGGSDVRPPDSSSHRHRQEMFPAGSDAAEALRLANVIEEQWRLAAPSWTEGFSVVLHERIRDVMCRAACLWAGVPIADDSPEGIRDLGEMLEAAGWVDPTTLLLRRRSERWARGVIDAVRAQAPGADTAETPLTVVARHCDAEGRLLDRNVAALELVNLLRPILAIARFGVFAALALELPGSREALRDGDDASVHAFAQEVCRHYPISPVVGGRALHDVWLDGRRIAAGSWVLFDVYGTNHDARLWQAPQTFSPRRFQGNDSGPYDFAPADAEGTHRCPIDDAVITAMSRVVSLLANSLEYGIPPQNLTVDLSGMPALPDSGLIVTAVRLV